VNDTTPTGAGEFMMSFFSGTRVSTIGSYSKIGTIRLSKNKRFKNGQLVGQASVANIEVGNIVAIQRTVFSYGVFKVASIVNASSLATDDYISFTVETMPNSTSDAKMFANRGLWNWPVSTGSSGGAGFSVVVSKNDSLSVPGNKSVSSESQSDDVAHASPLFLGSWTSKETGTSSLGANGAFNFLDSSGNEIGNSSSWANIVTARIGKVRNGGASDYFDFERFQVGALVSFGAYHLNFGANGLVPNRATYKISSLVDNTAYVQLNFESASATTSKLYSSKGAWVWGASLGTLNYLRIKVQLLAETETVVDGGAVLDGTVASDKITDGAVSTAKLGDGSITAVKVVDGTLTGTKIADATITGAKIGASTITGSNIGASTITGSNFVNGTITGSKIASATITGSNFVNGTITGSKIDAATITASNIVNGTITGTKIASSTITDSNFVNGTITGSKIDAATITGSNIANSTITGSKIGASTITGSNIGASTITGSNIGSSTIDNSKFVNGTIEGGKIAAATISGSNIGSSTISNSLLVDNTIQGGKIALATIQGGNIATNTITANNITVTTLSSLSANIGSISSGSLQGGTVPDSNSAPSGSETGSFFDLTLGRFVVGNATNYIWWSGTQLVIGGDVIATGNIQDDAISAAKMANNAVTSDTIAADAVVRAKIADDAINANKIASNAITATEIAANTITATQLTTGEFVTATANIGDAVVTNAKIHSLNADKIIADSTFTNNLTVGSSFKMNSSGKLFSDGKTDFGNATAGFFLGYSGGQYKFHLGDNTNYIKWNGSSLDVNGTLNIGSGEVTTALGYDPLQASDLGSSGSTVIAGDRLTTGTINANNVSITNISATNINTGTLNANNVTVTNLSASSINEINISGTTGSFTVTNTNGFTYNAAGYNTGIGQDAHANITTGSNGAVGNVAVGGSALENLTTSNYNTVVGIAAGAAITASSYSDKSGGGHHVLVGASAGRALVTGGGGSTSTSTGVIAIGARALVYATAGSGTIAIGQDALSPTFNPSAIRTEGGNIAIGNRAANRLQDGSNNTLVGTNVAPGLRAGAFNTAFGYKAALGHDASPTYGMGNTNRGSANFNVFIGFESGRRISGNANRNVFIGASSGTISSSNTATAYGPTDCVVIGENARIGTPTSGGATNRITIGADSYNATDNRIQLGNSSITSLYSYATLSQNSDERDKIEIQDNPFGLAFVKNIDSKVFRKNPRKRYNTFTRDIVEIDGEKTSTLTEAYDTEGFNAATKKDTFRSVGFIAQDLNSYISTLSDSDVAIVETSDEEEFGIRESQLIAVLWKAVQELSNKNDALEARLIALEDT